MPASTRFAVAIHTAGMLAFSGCMRVSSELIARSVNTNPVVVRRVIGLLTRNGIVRVRKGQGGGAVLTRPPEEITLDQIYCAVETAPILAIAPSEHSSQCPVGKHVVPVLSKLFSAAEQAMLDKLKSTTLAEVISAVKAGASAEGCFPPEVK